MKGNQNKYLEEGQEKTVDRQRDAASGGKPAVHVGSGQLGAGVTQAWETFAGQGARALTVCGARRHFEQGRKWICGVLLEI